jgi:hypothetical protein
MVDFSHFVPLFPSLWLVLHEFLIIISLLVLIVYLLLSSSILNIEHLPLYFVRRHIPLCFEILLKQSSQSLLSYHILQWNYDYCSSFSCLPVYFNFPFCLCSAFHLCSEQYMKMVFQCISASAINKNSKQHHFQYAKIALIHDKFTGHLKKA